MKSALIFGGTRGIGRSVAEGFISHGFAVTIASRTIEKVEETVEDLSLKGLARGCGADVSVYSEVKEALDSHLSHFENLEVVINTAAVQGPMGLLWENDAEAWCKTVSTNLVGSFNICRLVLPFMLKSGQGTIILFSGGGAAYARPRFSAYGASKTGVLRLVETIHSEMLENCGDAPGLYPDRDIRVYAVAPGMVRTRMTEEVLANQEQAGKKAYEEAKAATAGGGNPPEKAAELCLFLSNERPYSLSGKLIHVNEPYREYVNSLESATPCQETDECGLLRRVPFKLKPSG